MNIFKILGSGDGNIKEPNLSAFLGYLLNPKGDHGLGSAFLEKVLTPFIGLEGDDNPLKMLFSHLDGDSSEKWILDLSVNSKFVVEVVLEKALRANKNLDYEESGRRRTKEIVDIVIKIIQKEKVGKEDVSYLFGKETPICLILLENKINPCRTVGEQLKNQYTESLRDLPNYMTLDEWNKWEKNICTILVSTGGDNEVEQFEEFKDTNKNAIHLSWDIVDSDNIDDSIKSILLDLLRQSENGQIAPIPSYTSDTIKALINFVESDFSSDADDMQRGQKKGGSEVFDNIEKFKERHEGFYDPASWQLIEDFNHYILAREDVFCTRYSFTHPVSVFLKKGKKRDIKIFSLSTYQTGVKLHFVLRGHVSKNGITEEDADAIKMILNKYQIPSNQLNIATDRKTPDVRDMFRDLNKVKAVFESYYNNVVKAKLSSN